jgi:DNA-directed RNA polymerase alpha subunit
MRKTEAFDETIRISLAKIELAMGFDVRKNDFAKMPKFTRARRILEELRETIKSGPNSLAIHDVRIPEKCCGYLESAGIETVGQLRRMTDKQLLRVPQIKPGRLAEIDKALEAAGIPRLSRRAAFASAQSTDDTEADHKPDQNPTWEEGK